MEYVLELILSRIGARWGFRMAQALKRKGMPDDEFQCGIRVVSGAQARFTTKWRHGHARIRPYAIEFRRSPAITFAVRRVFLSEQRVPNASELRRISPDCLITPVLTDTATVELALLAADSSRALMELAEPARFEDGFDPEGDSV